jgi:CheY-like chemotaxis protein
MDSELSWWFDPQPTNQDSRPCEMKRFSPRLHYPTFTGVPNQGEAMSGERVMVVCEQPGFRDELAKLIEDHGLESYAAADGIDALRQIYHVRPQVIVSDAALSQLSGFEFLPFVRRRFPRVGVIAVADKRDCREDRPIADLLVPKEPWNPESFIVHLRRMLSQWPLRPEETDCA